jgi:hypothetical protein
MGRRRRLEKLLGRLRDPTTRAKIKLDMAADHPAWRTFSLTAGTAPALWCRASKIPTSRSLTVRRLHKLRRRKEIRVGHLLDFVIADKGQTGALYFMANENDLVYGLKQPWTVFALMQASVSGWPAV